jgi:hypothetical protein
MTIETLHPAPVISDPIRVQRGFGFERIGWVTGLGWPIDPALVAPYDDAIDGNVCGDTAGFGLICTVLPLHDGTHIAAAYRSGGLVVAKAEWGDINRKVGDLL